MPGAWDRLITEMLRHMIREFMCHPAELLSFRQLAHRIDSDSDVLHAIAEQRSDLFLITRNDRFVKLFPEAVQRIAETGVERTIAEVRPMPSRMGSVRLHRSCDHFSSEDEVLTDLRNWSFTPDALTRNCCWNEICRVRGTHPGVISPDAWSEICRVRGYLQARQNPRGF
jgi:hypothetical protein